MTLEVVATILKSGGSFLMMINPYKILQVL